MQNNIANVTWQKQLKRGFEKKYIELVIHSYKKVYAVKGSKVLLEDQRRNRLCEQMRKDKYKFGIGFNISTECGIYDENYKSKGFIDICCYFSSLEDNYIAFECKRFIKGNLVKSHIKNEYYGEGIRRFEDNLYSEKVNIGGMLAFLESGNYSKLCSLMRTELCQYSIDDLKEMSNEYGHDCVFKTKHERINNRDIKLYHVLMDFS